MGVESGKESSGKLSVLGNRSTFFFVFQLPYKVMYAHGSIGHAICAAANEENVELIVLGNRGLGTIRRTILGSVCDFVTQNMDVPVLMVPTEDKC